MVRFAESGEFEGVEAISRRCSPYSETYSTISMSSKGGKSDREKVPAPRNGSSMSLALASLIVYTVGVKCHGLEV